LFKFLAGVSTIIAAIAVATDWNEPKNLLFCDLRTFKKVCLPTFDDGQGLNGVGASSISSKKAQPSFLIVVLR
jgi:hypothetical protein